MDTDVLRIDVGLGPDETPNSVFRRGYNDSIVMLLIT